MIIQSLVNLAVALKERDRKNPNGLHRLPLDGYSPTRIGFIINLDRKGFVTGIADVRREKHIEMVPMMMGATRASNIIANLLFDKCEYSLGLGDGPKTPLRYAEFVRTVNDLPVEVRADEGVNAVLEFLKQHKPEAFRDSHFGKLFDEFTANVAFRLDGDDELVCQREAVQIYVTSKEIGGENITCMVTGKPGQLARLHPKFQGIYGAKPTGAALISINTDGAPALSYYGRKQGANAPITTETTAAYGTALRYALDPEHGLRFRLLDNVMIGWSNTTTFCLPPMVALLTQAEDNTSTTEESVSPKILNANDVKELLYAPSLGVPASDLEADYYIVGLTGVDGRVAVTFFQTGRLGDLTVNVNNWLEDLALAGRSTTSKRNGRRVIDILAALAPPKGGKKDFDRLAGRQQTELLFAALNGTRLPTAVANQALVRLRLPNYPDDRHTLTAIIKLHLNRNLKKGISVALNESCSDAGYLYGRAFAVIERAQVISAGRQLNAGIRDKYLAAASITPTRIFPILDRLFIVYLRRFRNEGIRHWLEREYRTIMELRDTTKPADNVLDLSQQQMFHVGYWQQQSALWTKKTVENVAAEAE